MGAMIVVLGTFPGSSVADEMHEEGPKPGFILDAGEGEAIGFPLHPTLRLAAAGSNQAGMSFFEIEIPANSAGAPPHRHTHEDEFFYVRQGSVTFMVDGERKMIGAGGFVLLPRDGWHAVWNPGDKSATLLVGTSAGRFDDFFDAVAMEVAAAGELSPPEVGAIVGRLGVERGIIIDMDRLPDDVRGIYGLPVAAKE
jgi:mannose-6-phosphate isomerase-like protein (cupin superfamily)